ncbi:flagellar protein FlaG [Lysinibacillus sp. BW-2-10]|uniref:flagellar protein FlaG n=1 Tax=Lysinibacillus sp. BW-2-10 TaxID=2590030 RepID=UPI00117F03BB|nr:flagellar protein FlaG [Lysinibacillus sp. BW-2-10]TSI04299.1 flagellar protein FlaG [Lysinibacillus sp. BW-2-10]
MVKNISDNQNGYSQVSISNINDTNNKMTSAQMEKNQVAIKETSSREETTEEILPAEKAQQMTESLNTLLETTNTKLRYEFHEQLEKYYVTLVDTRTDEVVQEIPNKKLMDMYAAMLEFVGVFIDKKI